MQIIKRIAILLLLFITLSNGYAQTYNFKNYNVEDGLAQSQIFTLFQDNKGYMWFGTSAGGVSMYDGIKFKNFSSKDGLTGNTVYSITQNKKGDIFFGTYDGLCVYNGFEFKSYTDKNQLPSNTVYAVYLDRNDKLWIGTNKGVCTWENGKIVPFTKDTVLAGKSVFTIYEDAAGNMWFGTTRNGAIKYNKETNKFITFTVENGTLLSENFVRCFGEDHKGNVIIGTVAGCVIISPDNVKHKLNINMQEFVGFTCVFRDQQNVLWLTSDNGIYKYANDKLVNHFTIKKGLIGNAMLYGLQDKEGNYWFGTNGFGITKLTSEMFTNYSVANGLPGEYINCVFQDSKGSVWMGVGDNGAVRLKDGVMTRFHTVGVPATERIIDKTVQTIKEDRYGNIWMGTQTGISVYDGKSITNYTSKQGLLDTNVYSIHVKEQGDILIGTHNGLYTFDGSRFYPIQEINSLKGKEDAPIYSIMEDNKGTIWLSTSKGVIKYENKKVALFNASNGFIDQYVFSSVQDKKGNYWFATESGIYQYNGSTFNNINDTLGLSSNQVWSLLMDDKNNLWIGTNNGLDKMSLDDYYSAGKVTINHYGKEEGLKGLECNMNAGMHDVDGNLWFGTIKGVTIYNPRFDKVNYKEPYTHITHLRLFFEPADLTEFSDGVDSTSGLPINLILPYSKNHVTFDFIGICETNPGKVLYSFKLEGSDENWSPPSTRTDATYSSLQPGDYTFMIKSMNNDGIWNETPVTFKFTVLPPWYRTWWFYSICVIVVIASVYFYNAYKTQKLTQDKIKLEKEVQLRTRELREEKEKVEMVNKEVIEQKAIIEHKNSEITDSIRYAKDIQQALLPSKTLLQKDIPDSFMLYMPKDIVSGDFYWFAKRDGKNYFASCDCTGHGVPGAFMSIVGNSLLQEIVGEQNIFQPAEILNHLDAGVKIALNHNKGEQERRDGMDIALCAINRETMKLEYAGANRPLWIFRNGCEGVCEIVKPDKFAIGGIDLEQKHPFTPHEINVNHGDVLYTFSDGYADQFGGDRGKKMMVGNLQKLLGQIYTKPMDEQREVLLNHFNNWKGEHEQIDDVLIIGVRV